MPITQEAGSNDSGPRAMPAPVPPAAVAGRLDRSGAADWFSFEARAAETWIVDCVAKGFGSPLSPVFVVRDMDGALVAQGEVVRGADPRAEIDVTRSGRYTIELRDGGSRSGHEFSYLLTVGKTPLVRNFTPHAERPGRAVGLVIDGVNLGGTVRARIFVPRDARSSVWSWVRSVSGPSLPFLFPISSEPAIAITESDQTMPLPAVPAALEGKLEVNRFARYYFDALPGDHLQFSLRTRSIGSRLRARLRVSDDANTLAESSDDEILSFSAAHPGRYFVAVAGNSATLGADGYYRLEVRREEPGFDALVERSGLMIEAGTALRLPVVLRREGGYTGDVEILAGSLPKGVRVGKARVAAGAMRAVVTIEVDRNAPREPFLLRMTARGRIGGTMVEHSVRPVEKEGDSSTDCDLLPVVILPPASPASRG
jgi:hypothetical protein